MPLLLDRKSRARRQKRFYRWRSKWSCGTALLGWAMLSLPKSFAPELISHKEDMLRFLGERYAEDLWRRVVRTGLFYFRRRRLRPVARQRGQHCHRRIDRRDLHDGPGRRDAGQFARLNKHGVPRIPLIVAVAIPILVLAIMRQFESLAGLYAIGVVGAIAVNLGACTFNKHLGLRAVRTPDHGSHIPRARVSRSDHRQNET